MSFLREPVAHMTEAEYVAAELVSDTRHEYLRGEIYAMAGGTPEHAALAASLAVEIGMALRDKPCRVFSSDARVRIEATEMTTYPDLTVVCGTLLCASGDDRAIVNPIVICEVLSESTEAYDRGAKASHYRHLSSLEEYVLVSQTEPRVEVQRRNAAGHWELHEFGADAEVTLQSLGITISVAALYRNPLVS